MNLYKRPWWVKAANIILAGGCVIASIQQLFAGVTISALMFTVLAADRLLDEM